MKNKEEASVVLLKNKKNKFLALKRSPDSKTFPEKWNFPGGGVEEGESVKKAAQRELKEETDLNVKLDDLKYFGFSSLPKIIIHFFITEKFHGEVEINKESSDFKWVELEDIPKMNFIPLSPNILKDIKYYSEVLCE